MSKRDEGMYVCGAIHTLISHIMDDKFGRVLNVLDMPLYPHSAPDSLDLMSDHAIALNDLSEELGAEFLDHVLYRTRTLPQWMMVASKGAFHRLHIDSAGLVTSVRFAHRTKLWFVADSFANGEPLEDARVSKLFRQVEQPDLVRKFRWEAVLLEEGSVL